MEAVESNKKPDTKLELESKLKDKAYEVWKWSELITKCGAGSLPDGTKTEDYDGAFAAINGAEKALHESRELVEKLFNHEGE